MGQKRHSGRLPDELRTIAIHRELAHSPHGHVRLAMGNTIVYCSAVLDDGVPNWMGDRSGQGWVTAEYAMHPASTGSRKPREGRRGNVSGRTQEIQRLIGRALRAVTDRRLLGERTLWIDCDVLRADGGTRCASVTGAWLAAMDAVRKRMATGAIKTSPFRGQVAAVSVGMVKGQALLDLDYREDVKADVDMNVVMTDDGRFVELQGTAEADPFTQQELDAMITLARAGITQLIEAGQAFLREPGTPS